MTKRNSRKSALTNLNSLIGAPTCPKCGQTLTTLHYTEYGAKTWTSKGWQERDMGDAEWRTGCCDAELVCDDLQELGVF